MNKEKNILNDSCLIKTSGQKGKKNGMKRSYTAGRNISYFISCKNIPIKEKGNWRFRESTYYKWLINVKVYRPIENMVCPFVSSPKFHPCDKESPMELSVDLWLFLLIISVPTKGSNKQPLQRNRSSSGRMYHLNAGSKVWNKTNTNKRNGTKSNYINEEALSGHKEM